MSEDRTGETFFGRWSRLKRTRDRGATDADLAPLDEAAPKFDGALEETSTHQGDTAVAEDAASQPRPAALDIDIESLSYESDFTPFMEKGAPDELRTEALRKLWTTDPVFGIIDGLDDYCEDFSDAAWVSPDMKTAYKVGQGFLSDSEIGVEASSGESETVRPDAAELVDDTAVAEDAAQATPSAVDAEAQVANSAPDENPAGDDPPDPGVDSRPSHEPTKT